MERIVSHLHSASRSSLHPSSKQTRRERTDKKQWESRGNSICPSTTIQFASMRNYLFLLFLFLYVVVLRYVRAFLSLDYTFHPVSFRFVSNQIHYLEDVVQEKKDRNAVFIAISTYAYRSQTADFYKHNNLKKYHSFFVVTQDEPTYYVCIITGIDA